MPTTRALLDAGIERLRAAGSESPRLDAQLLLAHVNGVDRTAILAHPDALVGTGPAEAYESLLVRREAGEPVAYLRGIKEFHGLAFVVDARALIPRPETERLVDLALTNVMSRLSADPDGQPPRIVDVGTGSGAVAVALAAALRARRVPADAVTILAVDVSADALDLARENAVGHGVGDRLSFEIADLLPPDSLPLDLVLANLPYVRATAMTDLPVATTFEPALALDGGEDGLRVIERLLDRLPDALASDGLALLEIGADQEAGISALVASRLPGFTCVIERDLGGLPRVASIRRSPAAASA